MCGPQQAPCWTLDTDIGYCLVVPDTRLFDCGLLEVQCDCPIPQAEPDIAGIGVLIAFLFSAFLTWIAAVAYLILKPRLKRDRDNKIDDFWTRHICAPMRGQFKKSDIWAECCLRVTFALSDQQLVTGIAILIADFKLLGEGRMTAYHFTVVRDLAFFSSESHLLSLLALWSAFSSIRLQTQHANGSHRLPIPTVTIIRFFLMIGFFGLLLSATWITAFRLHDDWARCPMKCVLQLSRGLGGVPLRWAIASTVFLVTQYFGLMLQLGETILGRFDILRQRTRSVGDSLCTRLRKYSYGECFYRSLGAIVLAIRFYFFSEFFVIVEVMAWFVANCVFASQNRASSKEVFGNTAGGVRERRKEDDLGFGQIVPLLLLIVPFMTFIGTYHGKLTPDGQVDETDYVSEQIEIEHARRRHFSQREAEYEMAQTRYDRRQRAEYELARWLGWLPPRHT